MQQSNIIKTSSTVPSTGVLLYPATKHGKFRADIEQQINTECERERHTLQGCAGQSPSTCEAEASDGCAGERQNRVYSQCGRCVTGHKARRTGYLRKRRWQEGQ